MFNALSSYRPAPVSHPMPVEKNNQGDGLFQFPDNCILTLNGKETIDVSHIKIDLSEIFIGGIGYGGGAAQLMAQAMHTFGHRTPVYHLPFCIESSYSKFKIISKEDKVMQLSTIKEMIDKTVQNGFTHFYIPLDRMDMLP